MSLIAGMPEVIAYIRSQDERIKALKEENERLGKQRVLDIQRMMKGDEYKKENKSLKESARIQWQRADKYYESIKELTEENEKLKEEIGDLRYRETCRKAEIQDLESSVEMYAQHNKKLNREMEESEKYDWEKKYHHLNSRFIALENIEKKLKKSNKKYHMECLKLNRELGDWHKALNEDVAGLEHLQSEINLHFWKRCHGPWDADIEKINQN